MEGITMTLLVRKSSLMPEWVEDIFEHDLWNTSRYGRNNNLPAVNIIEGNDEFRIEVAAPGLSKGDFKIDVENGELIIASERKIEHGEKENYMRREFYYNNFKRTFSLPDSVNVDNISAKHENGILHIFIPKKEEAKVKPPKEIKIS
jgi:HSP20 family protein